MLVLVGLAYFALYFVVFYFLIGRFNLKTPGRGDTTNEDADATLDADADVMATADQIIKGLGGAENIKLVDYCTTRLRCTVDDYVKVKESEIKKAGIAGVIRPSQTSVQVVVGPQVQFVYDAVADRLRSKDVALEGAKDE